GDGEFSPLSASGGAAILCPAEDEQHLPAMTRLGNGRPWPCRVRTGRHAGSEKGHHGRRPRDERRVPGPGRERPGTDEGPAVRPAERVQEGRPVGGRRARAGREGRPLQGPLGLQHRPDVRGDRQRSGAAPDHPRGLREGRRRPRQGAGRRVMVQYEHIGYDPAPGDHTVTGSLATGLTGGHETLERVTFLLASVNECEWFGEPAIAFRSMLHDDFRPKVSEAEGAFRKAAGALETWATKLSTFRTDANDLDRRLGEAKAARDAAERRYHGSEDLPRPDDDATDAEHQRYEQNARERGQAREALDSAQQHVDGVWREIEQLVRSYDAASRTLLDEFDTAAAMAPDDPSWWDKAVDWV